MSLLQLIVDTTCWLIIFFFEWLNMQVWSYCFQRWVTFVNGLYGLLVILKYSRDVLHVVWLFNDMGINYSVENISLREPDSHLMIQICYLHLNRKKKYSWNMSSVYTFNLVDMLYYVIYNENSRIITLN